MCIVALLVCAFAFPVLAQQEYVIRNFPIGVGQDVPKSFWTNCRSTLEDVARALQDSTLRLEVYAWVDAAEYRDAALTGELNAALSGDRYLAVVKQLLDVGVGSHQILPNTQRRDTLTGATYRRVELRIVPAKSNVIIHKDAPAPKEQAPTCVPPQVTPVTIVYDMVARVGLGVAYVPTGTALPVVHGELGSNRLRLALDAGLTFWGMDESFEHTTFSTRHTYLAVHGLWRAHRSGHFYLVAGWYRNEERSQDVDRYLERREGIDVGGRFAGTRFGLTATWSPGVLDGYGYGPAPWHADQFRVSVDLTLLQGGK